jgi:glycerol-3-phosphate O-acyltransferase
VLTCVMAANTFVANWNSRRAKLNTNINSNLRQYRVAGSTANVDRSAIWALTQPRGFFLARVAGWCLSQLFFICCSQVTVDIASFCESLRAVRSHNGSTCIVLAPTHRSFFDFLLLSYVFFCIPELQIDIPFIVAADDFEELPLLGFLARSLKSFYISREKSKFDPDLASKLSLLSKRTDGSEFYVEVFIEGKRSRDRRFERPKTGILRCLHKTERNMVIVPIAISYERLPEQESLASEAEGGRAKGYCLASLVAWLYVSYEAPNSLSHSLILS